MPSLVEHASAGAFLERAGAWLREREDHHNLILDFAQGMAAVWTGSPHALFATVEEDVHVAGCVVRVAPHQALLTELPGGAARAVGSFLAERCDGLPGVVGPKAAALGVARAWGELRGGTFREGMRQGLHRLDSVTLPERSSGRMRPARAEDARLVLEWCRAFAEDTGIDYTVTQATLNRWLTAGALQLWEAEGETVCMAVAQGRTEHGIRIGFVYTPPDQRGRGHASGLVGVLSKRMLDDGCDFCVLYTDLANPTPNAIYRRLGYEMIGEVLDVHLIEPEVS